MVTYVRKFMMTEAINPNYMYLGTMTLTYLEALEDRSEQSYALEILKGLLHPKQFFAKMFMPDTTHITRKLKWWRQFKDNLCVRSFCHFTMKFTEAVCLSADGESGKYNTIESCKVEYKLIHYIVEYLSIQLPQRFLRYLTISRLFWKKNL